MTIGEDITEPLINSELNPPPLTTSIFINAENYAATRPRPLSDGHSNNPVSHDPSDKRWVWGEICEQLWLSGPIMAMYILQYVMAMTGIVFVGHLGAFPLAVVSLANSVAGITGFTVLMGLSSALETLCGQAYGAKQYHLLGIYLQRAVFILIIAAVPICLVWLNMNHILIALGEEPDLAAAAQSYIVWLIPILFAYTILLPLIKFFQTQRAVYQLTLCAAAMVIVHVPLCWLVIDKLRIGYNGAAIAITFSLLVEVSLLAAFVRFSSRFEKTFDAFSPREALQDFGNFFRLAIPSAFMICLEYWSIEILTLLAGLLPNSKLSLSSFAICLGLLSLANMISGALGVAASVRVSNELGAGEARAARSAVAVSVGLGWVEGIIMACVIFSSRNVWGWVFTNDREVVEHVAHTAPYLAVLSILYSGQAILSGVVRGMGWQRVGAFANLGALYGVGLPVAVTAAFYFHFRHGLWIGMGCGWATQVVALIAVLLSTNWEKMAKEALLRSNSYTARLPSTAPLLTKLEKENNSNDVQQVSVVA